ncbi:LuxR family transcriptional regulator [Nonomuraea turcica]|uniref:LuxR family transcriptional regulator n=1 Tax=Nonomuraea sp. G32 TaxID=3067274 RepID=UPI00273CAF7B|nr:LuxR C-terminal-related transcriptional regulator [Nonomuraea sp. G32]MDP4501407.1 LuxR C-terminal-related transcriptional regulator [Nonomuraea sp. G32]
MVDMDGLTARELQVLSLTCAGHSAQEIADRLHIARCTVENHKRHIYQKLGVAGQAQAVSHGLALDLLHLRPRAAARVIGEGQVSATIQHSAPRPRVSFGRDLVVLHARCVVATEIVTRTMIGGGRPLFAVRDTVTGDDAAAWQGVLRFTAVLVDPLPADWLLPVRLGARAVAVPSAPPCPTTVADAMAHGAYAVLWLEDVPDHLCAVLDLVAGDYVVVGADMCRRLLPTPHLTGREHDVLVAIAAGRTIRQTGRLLGIASKTVESTRARLFRKLDARNRSEVLANAYRAGLLPTEPPTPVERC